jgi:hypothetical protein
VRLEILPEGIELEEQRSEVAGNCHWFASFLALELALSDDGVYGDRRIR